ncbi:MAG: aminotransferase class III-fold pyridoxal phosphate-dependent enzyme, partial [Bacillota bacterium]
YLAMDHWNTTADLVTLGKGIGGGYTPLGAVMIHEKVYEVFNKNWGRFIHGYTYQGNPVSCAAGIAVNTYLRENGLFEKVSSKGDYLKNKLETLTEKYDIIGDVRGIGLLLGLELVKNRESKESFPATLSVAEKAREQAMEEGLMVYTGVGGTADIVPRDYLIIAPPFIINEEEMDLLIQSLDRTIASISGDLS